MRDQVEEIKSKVDVVQIISEYVKLTKAGRNFKGLCPFHGEKTPSFMVNPELQIFKCFGCGEGGDIFEFVMKMEGAEFGEVLRMMAKKVGVTLASYTPTKAEDEREKLYQINKLTAEYYHYLLTKHEIGQEALKYLNDRKITNESIDRFNLGFSAEGWDYLIKFLTIKKDFKIQDLERAGLVIPSPKGGYDRFRNRVMFPLANHRGLVVGFAGRVMPAASAEAAASQGGKYVNTPETEIYHKGDLLYGLDLNKAEIKSAGWVVVVEGEIDSIASWQAGVRNVVAIKGSALTQRQVDVIKRYTDTVILALDADLAGDMAARRGIEIAEKAGLIIKVTNPKAQIAHYKYKDPGECATEDPEMWKKIVEGAVPIYDFYISSAVERHGLEAVGKAKIGKELLPIWAKIEDEITKGHYIKRLAEVLGVGEGDVRRQLEKIQNSKSEEPNKFQNLNSNDQTGKSRRERVEEEIIRQAVLGDKLEALVTEPLRKWIGSEFWQRVIEEFAKGKRVTDLPAELKTRTAELLLNEWEFSEAEWTKTMREMEIEYIKGTKAGMDSGKDLQKIDDLNKRYNDLTKGR
jgi:DNA primase